MNTIPQIGQQPTPTPEDIYIIILKQLAQMMREVGEDFLRCGEEYKHTARNCFERAADFQKTAVCFIEENLLPTLEERAWPDRGEHKT